MPTYRTTDTTGGLLQNNNVIDDDPVLAEDQGLAPNDPNNIGPTEVGAVPRPSRTAQTDGLRVTVSSGVFQWTCTGVASHGTFNNGDPWVVPTSTHVSVVSITPAPYKTDPPQEYRRAHGSMINPDVYEPQLQGGAVGHAQGYDSEMFGPYGVPNDYQESLNVAASLPIRLVANDSLVSTQSHGAAGVRPQLKRAAVLTCLASAPAAGSFRPGYTKTFDGTKTIYTKTGIDYGALDILDEISTPTPSFSATADRFARVHLNHIPSWLQRYQHPSKNMSDYGRDITAERGNAILMCLLNVGQAAKEELLLNVLQVGIDMYAQAKYSEERLLETLTYPTVRTNQQYKKLHLWPTDGGHFNGNKWIILFTGMVLGIQDMIDITADDNVVAFSEDDSTHYLDAPGTTQPEWSDKWIYDNANTNPIWVALTDGQMEATYGTPVPAADAQRNKSVAYRRCCTANTWWGMILGAAALPNARTNWGHEALFDYQVRYRATEPTYVKPGERFTLVWGYPDGEWALDMWDTYASTYSLD